MKPLLCTPIERRPSWVTGLTVDGNRVTIEKGYFHEDLSIENDRLIATITVGGFTEPITSDKCALVEIETNHGFNWRATDIKSVAIDNEMKRMVIKSSHILQ